MKIKDSNNIQIIQGVHLIPPGSMELSAEDINKINVESRYTTIEFLVKRLHDYKEIKVEGYFHRKSHLWSDATKSSFIETMLIGIPIQPLYFDITDKDTWLVVDGLQRISAISSFYKNELKLKNLNYRKDLEGKTYQDLERPLQRQLDDYRLQYNAILPGTPRSVRYRIFKSINESGLVLNAQEIRHAMHSDERLEFTPSKQIENFAAILNKFIEIAASGERSKERMYDRELALRFVAFQIFDYKKDYTSKTSLQGFLDNGMEAIYAYNPNKLEVLKENFAVALGILTQIFEADELFSRKMFDKKSSKLFSGTLYEIWTFAIAKRTIEEQIILVKNKPLVREKNSRFKTKRSVYACYQQQLLL